MLYMSVLIGIMSVATSYWWWTIDWWRPLTITGTKVGIEDFITGFAAGGIMATIYEVIFKRAFYKRALHHHVHGGLTILLILAMTTSWLFWGIGFSSFHAAILAMSFIAVLMILVRRDLFWNALLSGFLMLLVSLPFYYSIILISPEWIDKTYLTDLSGVRVTGIPVEELIFWFFAGLVWGPFYEYWQGNKLRRMK